MKKDPIRAHFAAVLAVVAALTMMGCSDKEEAARKAGFENAKEMELAQSKGFRSKEDFVAASKLGFENAEEMRQLQTRGYKDRSDYIETLSLTPEKCFANYQVVCKGRRITWIGTVTDIVSWNDVRVRVGGKEVDVRFEKRTGGDDGLKIYAVPSQKEIPIKKGMIVAFDATASDENFIHPDMIKAQLAGVFQTSEQVEELQRRRTAAVVAMQAKEATQSAAAGYNSLEDYKNAQRGGFESPAEFHFARAIGISSRSAFLAQKQRDEERWGRQFTEWSQYVSEKQEENRRNTAATQTPVQSQPRSQERPEIAYLKTLPTTDAAAVADIFTAGGANDAFPMTLAYGLKEAEVCGYVTNPMYAAEYTKARSIFELKTSAMVFTHESASTVEQIRSRLRYLRKVFDVIVSEALKSCTPSNDEDARKFLLTYGR